jgi:hypothetical protein
MLFKIINKVRMTIIQQTNLIKPMLEKDLLLESNSHCSPASPYSTFCRIMHKTNAISKEVYDMTPTNKYEFYSKVFRYDIPMNNDMETSLTVSKLLLYICVTSFQYPSTKDKFSYVKDIQQNVFIGEETQKVFFDNFCLCQSIYWRLNRLVCRYKFKRMLLRSHTDLYLRPICENDKDVITLIHKGEKYIFTTTDIYKIVFSALTYSSYIIPQPIRVKNPYNNLPFSRANLYQIYFFLKDHVLILSPLIDNFFACEFNLRLFEMNNQGLLRNVLIDSILSNDGDVMRKCKYIHHMFDKVIYGDGQIVIDDDFPNDRLIEIMKPYLRLYVLSLYSVDLHVREQCRIDLRKKLERFYEFNPGFGRKIVVLNKPNKVEKKFEFRLATGSPSPFSKTENKKGFEYSFNETHIPFV